MKIVVISHTPHYPAAGRVVGWGPTVRELDHLATLFDELVHIAPLHDEPAPASSLPYAATNIRLVAVPPAGGRSFRAKLGVLGVLPRYVRAISRELGKAEVVHVRCPSNIGLIAVLVLALRRHPSSRWIKYAGNWRPRSRESRSYGVQRWLLARNVARALVTINGRWPQQPAHVRSFLNPCLTNEELQRGADASRAKALSGPVRLLFVGRLDEGKGCGRAIEILTRLRTEGVEAELQVVGDGPERERLQLNAQRVGLDGRVRFRGWVPRPVLADFYRWAHILLLPSSSEGWPKVLSEGMAYGVVPVTSDVSSIPQLLREFGAGRALRPDDFEGFVEAIRRYVKEPSSWNSEARHAVDAASGFTYRAYLDAVRSLLNLERRCPSV